MHVKYSIRSEKRVHCYNSGRKGPCILSQLQVARATAGNGETKDSEFSQNVRTYQNWEEIGHGTKRSPMVYFVSGCGQI
jgi:hypothetical protein